MEIHHVPLLIPVLLPVGNRSHKLTTIGSFNSTGQLSCSAASWRRDSARRHRACIYLDFMSPIFIQVDDTPRLKHPLFKGDPNNTKTNNGTYNIWWCSTFGNRSAGGKNSPIARTTTNSDLTSKISKWRNFIRQFQGWRRAFSSWFQDDGCMRESFLTTGSRYWHREQLRHFPWMQGMVTLELWQSEFRRSKAKQRLTTPNHCTFLIHTKCKGVGEVVFFTFQKQILFYITELTQKQLKPVIWAMRVVTCHVKTFF